MTHPSKLYADLYVALPVAGPFTYRIPEGMIVEKGIRVLVNFSGRKMPQNTYKE